MIDGIVIADRVLAGSVKVWLDEECQRCYEHVDCDYDDLDRLILRLTDQRLGHNVAVDVLDLDNDDRGVYGIVLIEAAPIIMNEVLGKLNANNEG
jgi:hypothetical protein